MHACLVHRCIQTFHPAIVRKKIIASFLFFSFFLCESMSNVDRRRTHMQQLQLSQQLQQPGGWRFVPDTILPGYQWAPQWVPARTPTVHWGPISGKALGGPNTVQHSSTVQKHGKHGSGAISIQGRSSGSKSTVDESLLCYDGSHKRRTH